MSTIYNAGMSENNSCIEHNLKEIQEKFGSTLRLSIVEMAFLLSTTPNNVVQMRRRGHFPFNSVAVGSRVFFPVHSVANWLCGGFEGIDESPALTVKLPSKTPRKSKSKQSWRDAILKFQTETEKRFAAIKSMDDQSLIPLLKQQHLEAGETVINEIERLWLQQRVWLQTKDTPIEAL